MNRRELETQYEEKSSQDHFKISKYINNSHNQRNSSGSKFIKLINR